MNQDKLTTFSPWSAYENPMGWSMKNRLGLELHDSGGNVVPLAALAIRHGPSGSERLGHEVDGRDMQ